MAATLDAPPRMRLSADDFYRMGEIGLFAGKNVILVGGELIEMPPEGARHFSAVHKVLRAFEPICPDGFLVRRPGPLQLSLETDPEPDVAIVRGRLEDFIDSHPTHAELVLEVSESSLRYDRNFKLALYAEARIPEYWIVVLPERFIEVYRLPTEGPEGWRYSQKTIHRAGGQVSVPHTGRSIDVADLLV